MGHISLLLSLILITGVSIVDMFEASADTCSQFQNFSQIAMESRLLTEVAICN